jgi:predicted nucleotide-binding protein (sugar kinase/HSP70/actin superfamily)
MWKTFFEKLGLQVVVSGHTTKGILERGARLCVDEACLPVKVAFGHVAELKEADYIFLPRLVSVYPGEYICPKFLGIPDMVKQCAQHLPPLIMTNFNQYRREGDLMAAFNETGRILKCNPVKVYLAYREAIQVHRRYNSMLHRGCMPEDALKLIGETPEKGVPAREDVQGRPVVAVIGHPYNIYDGFISMNLIKRLEKAGFGVVTQDHLTEETLCHYAGSLPKKLFWTLGRNMIGGALYYLADPGVKGLVHVASFACGPDSMTGELIERSVRRMGGKPFLNLTLDEHTGEAGVVTRLEAFADMINLRLASGS